MNAILELNTGNPNYVNEIKAYIWSAYLSDMKEGDITTEIFLKENRVIQAKVIAKESGVFAGLIELDWFLSQCKIHINSCKKDGDKFQPGETILEIQGLSHAILAAERTLLNLIQRMSGIATKTNQFVQKSKNNIQILATRKTFWGDLDKRAVAIGGGGTHRLNLNDAILIKENHIKLSSNLEESLLRCIKAANHTRFVELEVENLEEVFKLIEFFQKHLIPKNFVLMLDNFNPQDIKIAIEALKPFELKIEVSGGINESNIQDYCIEGVHYISSGSITNKAHALDLSLLIDS